MKDKKNALLEQEYYNYFFKCPTNEMDGQIKFFPSPIDETRCFICKRQKGLGDKQCDYEISGG